jgi:hypothetical protein
MGLSDGRLARVCPRFEGVKKTVLGLLSTIEIIENAWCQDQQNQFFHSFFLSDVCATRWLTGMTGPRKGCQPK